MELTPELDALFSEMDEQSRQEVSNLLAENSHRINNIFGRALDSGYDLEPHKRYAALTVMVQGMMLAFTKGLRESGMSQAWLTELRKGIADLASQLVEKFPEDEREPLQFRLKLGIDETFDVCEKYVREKSATPAFQAAPPYQAGSDEVSTDHVAPPGAESVQRLPADEPLEHQVNAYLCTISNQPPYREAKKADFWRVMGYKGSKSFYAVLLGTVKGKPLAKLHRVLKMSQEQFFRTLDRRKKDQPPTTG
jgi:hypothetical protein